MDGIYSKKVMNHFKKPHNMGKIKNPDGRGRVGNLMCGDVMELYIKVAKNKKGEDVIKTIKVSTLGCVAAIVTSSFLTEAAKGKTLEQALKITNQDIAKGLGGLPVQKMHCSLLAIDALAEAIYDYLSRHKRPISSELEKRHKRIQETLASIEKG